MALERPQSGWLDFLDWVRAPGRAVMNLDRPEYARGYLADFAVGPLDAVVPGDLVETRVPEDTREYNALVEAAANPLTYAGMLPGVRRAVPAAAKYLGETGYNVAPKAVKRGIDATRRTLGWEDYAPVELPDRTYQFDPPGYVAPIDPATGKPLPAPPVSVPRRKLDVAELLGRSSGVETTAAQAQLADLTTRVAKAGQLTKDEDRALADVIDNLDWSGGNAAVLDATHNPAKLDLPGRIAAAKTRLNVWASKNPAARIDKNKLTQLIDDHYQMTTRQLDEARARGAIGEGRGQGDYLMRVYEGVGGSNVAKPREFQTAAELVQFLGQNPDLGYSRSWAARMTERAHKQGRLLRRAYLREQLTDPVLARHLLNPNDTSAPALEARRLLDEAFTAAKPGSDSWARLRYELSGDAPRNAIETLMTSVNRVFKPAAVYGVGPFVRIGSIVRNQLTNYWTLAQTPEGRAYLMRDPAMGVRNLVGAFDDGVAKNLFGSRLTGGDITRSLDGVEAALKQSQGSLDGTMGLLRARGLNLEADALENGVMTGFVMSEDLARASLLLKSNIDPRKWLIPGNSATADIGAKMFGGLEQRMRFAYFKDLVQNQKKSASEAAKLVQDRFLDYTVSSGGNRQLRTYFPFAQFVVKTIPQQAKFFAATPAALPAVAALYGGDDLPGWAREQAHVGTVLPGVAPTDVMNMIPDITASSSFEQFQQSAAKTAGALHPVIGAGIGLVSGVDTFTGKPYMEDARLPGRDPRTTQRTPFDTAWGLGEDLGVLQPVSGPVGQASSLRRMDGGSAALRYLTGVNVLPDDPIRAEADRLRAALQSHPDLRQSSIPYASDPTPDVAAALKRLEEVRRELAARAAASGSPGLPAPPP